MDKSKYIGKHVIAGGEINGIRGYIVDVTEEYDDIFGNETWFHIKDEYSGIVERYDVLEIQEIKVKLVEVYEPLE